MHNIIEGNSFFEIPSTIWYKIIFWTQNRKNCKLCRILRRDFGSIVVAHRFRQREKLFNFDEVDYWILIVSRYWWETSPMVGYVSSWKMRVAVVGNDFTESFFRGAKCCFFIFLTDSYLLFMDISFSGRSFNDFLKRRCFFFGELVQVLTLFCFSVIYSE